jgi:hypothetical protein
MKRRKKQKIKQVEEGRQKDTEKEISKERQLF